VSPDSGKEKGDRGYGGVADPALAEKRDFWDGRAREFSRHAASTGYPEKFIRVMNPSKTWTVIDMGCGGGTIAVPLAGKVRSVTAVDLSGRMLEIVGRRCRDAGISNVKTIQGRWEDDWDHLGLGVHDVAIASRSLITDDMEGAIAKLAGIAGKAVYISTLVGSGPYDKGLFESTGRILKVGTDYIHCYTMLYRMNIRANVVFILERHRDQWDSHEDAFEDHRWMFRGMTDEEEGAVRRYLKQHLVKVAGCWRLPYPRKCYWAVLWWKKEGGATP